MLHDVHLAVIIVKDKDQTNEINLKDTYCNNLILQKIYMSPFGRNPSEAFIVLLVKRFVSSQEEKICAVFSSKYVSLVLQY